MRTQTYYVDTPVNSSGTFTHAYAAPGTYTPVFTITDDYGHTTRGLVTTRVILPTSSVTGGTVATGDCSGYYTRDCGGVGRSTSDCTGYYTRGCVGTTSISSGSGTTYYNSGYRYDTSSNTASSDCSGYYTRNCTPTE